jgi:glycosyltransferase involved in cell wall biosynthesis
LKNPDLKATPDTASPVFGFLLFGGPLSGALVRDARLANELARRGWPVHVWWAMDREKTAPLDARIQQRWLFHGFRYLPPWSSGLADTAGRLLTAATHDKNRARSAQKRHEFLRRVMEGLMRAAAVQRLRPQLRYLVTFQGYELYVNYARNRGQEQDLFARFRDLVERSGMPAVAVSEDYVTRVHEDVGVPAERLRAIPPGVPVSEPMDHDEAVEKVARKFPAYRRGVPLVTYLGRRDTEKGIDLLLYAARILLARGVDLQVAVVGPTLFGTRYAEFCQQLAQDLRCPVLWSNKVPNELRSALFVASRCIVYPSIHREPFGMVSVEALAHGTPAVVPDHGGVAGTIEAAGETAGLRFRVWDSGDLATQIERLIREDGLHGRLAALGPRVAEFYSVANLADRVLRHLGLPPRPGAPGPDNRAEMTPPATATVVSS